MSQSYRSDLTDEQWELLQKLIPEAKPGGRPRSTVGLLKLFYAQILLRGLRYCRGVG
jgi:transposase